jgi:hypothetical protein
MQAMTFMVAPQVWQVLISMLKTRFRRFAQVIDARRSVGDGRSSTTLALWPLPRFAGVTNARCLLLGANTVHAILIPIYETQPNNEHPTNVLLSS